jgi:hypothetical protein
MRVKLDGIQARCVSIQFFHRRLCLLTSRHWQHRSYLRPAVNLFQWLKSTKCSPLFILSASGCSSLCVSGHWFCDHPYLRDVEEVFSINSVMELLYLHHHPTSRYNKLNATM